MWNKRWVFQLRFGIHGKAALSERRSFWAECKLWVKCGQRSVRALASHQRSASDSWLRWRASSEPVVKLWETLEPVAILLGTRNGQGQEYVQRRHCQALEAVVLLWFLESTSLDAHQHLLSGWDHLLGKDNWNRKATFTFLFVLSNTCHTLAISFLKLPVTMSVLHRRQTELSARLTFCIRLTRRSEGLSRRRWRKRKVCWVVAWGLVGTTLLLFLSPWPFG